MVEKAFLVESLRTSLRARCVGLQSEMTTDGLREGRLTAVRTMPTDPFNEGRVAALIHGRRELNAYKSNPTGVTRFPKSGRGSGHPRWDTSLPGNGCIAAGSADDACQVTRARVTAPEAVNDDCR
jgi:hypothetical protein